MQPSVRRVRARGFSAARGSVPERNEPLQRVLPVPFPVVAPMGVDDDLAFPGHAQPAGPTRTSRSTVFVQTHSPHASSGRAMR